jgi:hypothetical protein
MAEAEAAAAVVKAGGGRDNTPRGGRGRTTPSRIRSSSQASSPAIGYSDTAYSPATDLDGTPRPQGAEDAGAFQYVAR